MSDNPLLDFGPSIPFDRITAADVEPAVDALLTDCTARLEAIKTGPITWDATAGALDRLTERLEEVLSVVDHLESVLDDPDLRTAYNATRPRISAFYAQLGADTDLYEVIRRLADSPAAKAFDATQRRYVDETLASFRRSGAELDPAGKERLQAIEVELAQTCTTFAQNTVDSTDVWHLDLPDPSRLAGVPERAIAAAKAAADAAGVDGYRLTLQAPSFMPVMRYADDAGLRETIWRAYMTRATRGDHDNRPLVGRILALRAEKAKLLGYADVSDLLLESRMVRNGAAAWDFVQGLTARTRPFFETEEADLAAFARGLRGDDAPPLQPWEGGYYAEKLRQDRYAFDEEALRPYFPADTVIAGLFEIAHRLYGVKITPLADRPVWHPDVQVYALDDADGTRWGVFYTDLYPRAGKRAGAWMRPFMTGDPATGGAPHVGLFCANFTPPVGDTPALLSHREVETLFHEFGHLLHHLLTDVSVRSLAGTNVAWDFVELPSQIMENWTWAEEALALFARHYETGETIPRELLDRMQAARTFRAAAAQMRQLSFATVDLSLHRLFDPASGDAVAYARTVAQSFSTATLPDEYAMVASFGHLFASPAGYAAAYYSYKWAELLDADAFTRFEDGHLFDAEVGRAFRAQILSKGNSRDPAALYRDFMGRDPDPEALMRRAGLTAQAQ